MVESKDSILNLKDHLISDEEFMKKRLIFMEDDFDEEVCNKLKKRILYLLTHDPKEPVTLYISSYGGSVYSVLQIIDLLRTRKFELTIVALGYAMSGGAYLLLEGDRRLVYEKSTIMLHELDGFCEGKFNEVQIDYEETKRLQDILNEFVKERTKIKNPEEFLQKDRFFNAKDAKKFGIVDKIIKKRKKVKLN